jgi:cell division protein FtsA
VELFEIISKELEGLLEPDELKGGILLTGGASLLPGVDQIATKVLGFPTRRASFPSGIASELAQPENATVLGLLHYGLEDHGLPGRKKEEAETGFLGKFRKMVGLSPQH